MKNIIIILFIAATLVSCGGGKNPETTGAENSNSNLVELTADQIKNSEIKLGKTEERSISGIIKLNGRIDVPPQNMISVSAPLGGYLKETKLLPGMHISKGEMIAMMEDNQYIQIQEDYLIAKEKLFLSEKEFERQKELNASKAASDKVFQQAKSDYFSQKIMVKSLSEKLKLIGLNPDNLTENSLSKSIRINSPIDGYVSKVNVNIGKYLNPSDILFELVNPEDIHLVLNVFEKDIEKLAVGMKLWAYTNTNPDKRYPCEIIFIGKDVAGDRSVTVHCHFDKYDHSLIPGMYMNADAEINEKNGVVIRDEAIVNFEGKKYVFASKSKAEFEAIEVETGNSEEGVTEIVSANATKLKNREIVLKGAYNLLMAWKNKEE